MSSVAVPSKKKSRRLKPGRVVLQTFLIATAVVWIFPIAAAFWAALRPYGETSNRRGGLLTWPRKLSLDNFSAAFKQGQMARHFWITMLIVIPSLILTLLLASFVAFAVSRFNFRFNLALLALFTAGNLMPQQVIIQPLFQMYRRIPLPHFLSPDSGHLNNTVLGVIIIHIAFQIGFCTFVLSNYMKTIPKELGEAAAVDGAPIMKQFFRIILPICKPALAALATLEFTWIFNDFFWAVVLVSNGDNRPITSSIRNLSGQFLTDDNLVAAGSLMIALPTLIVYLILQKQFISGLTLGANKG